jgi:hemerythrin superfamily protein
MDVTALLEQDHRKVESLFTEYESGQSEDVLSQICDELEVHTTLEEELVYPRLAELDRDLEQHAEAEHDAAKLLIDQIRAGDPDVPTLARQLQTAVEAHVREEEGRAFPLLREQMGDELRTIGEEVARRKEQLTTAS